MFKFITGRPLWANILFAIALVVLVLFLILQSLNLLTKHGSTLVIPSVLGKPYDQAKKTLEDAGFDVQIQDSIFNDTAKAMAVLRQLPEGESIVKANRTVYLVVNRAVPPEIEMPNLEGLSFRSAEISLKQYGLKLGDTSYQNDIAKNAVLEQHFKGQRIKPGTRIAMGSSISLVLGSGLGQDQLPVPDLYGKTYMEARVLLESYGINLGVPIAPGITDTANAFIYQQRPEPILPDGRMGRIRPGQSIDIWLQQQRPEPRALVDSAAPVQQPE